MRNHNRHNHYNDYNGCDNYYNQRRGDWRDNCHESCRDNSRQSSGNNSLRDFGDRPLVINIDKAVSINDNFRLALWTGEYLQLTIMEIPVGCDIGVEMHPHLDQLFRIEQGSGIVCMGCSQNNLTDKHQINDQYAIAVPAGTWHNIVNTGRVPLKLYSVYSPPQHPFGTIHKTKADT